MQEKGKRNWLIKESSLLKKFHPLAVAAPFSVSEIEPG
jgi:hypothetical protein